MCNKNTVISTKLHKFMKSLVLKWSVCNHRIINSRQLCNLRWNRLFRIYKHRKLVFNFAINYSDCTNFCYLFLCCSQACCFEVKYYKFSRKQFLTFTINNSARNIIYKVCLNAIQNLNMTTFAFYSISGIHSTRESLYNAMVCNCNRRHTKAISFLNNISDI